MYTIYYISKLITSYQCVFDNMFHVKHTKRNKKTKEKEERRERREGRRTSKRSLQLRSPKSVKILIQLNYSHFIVFKTMSSSIKY